MERISTNYGTKLVSLFITLFFSLSVVVSAQNDCMGTQNVVVNPPPAGGGYAPGTVVEYCVTYNNWNTGIGTNWLEGFNLTVGAGWDLSTLTPTTYPPNQGGNGSGGQWLWIPNTFNSNPLSSGGGANQFGPGFFFDLNNDGQSVDDWGDFGTGPWTFCFEITVGNTPGQSLSMQVSPVSDGFAGSWATNGCNGFYQFQLSPNTVVLGCLTPPVISLVSVTDATCQGFTDGEIDVSVNQGTAPYTFYLDGNPVTFPVTNLSPGPYVVTCVDDDACNSNVLNVVVGENTPVVNNTINLVDNVCFDESNGSFEVTSAGGQTPYTYTFNGVSQLTGVYNNMPAGNHLIIVEDDNGCTYNHNVIISEPTDITNTPPVVTNLLCFGDNDGTITIGANGGTPPYLFELNGVVNNTGFFDNLPANAYTALITDDEGCEHIVPNIFVLGPVQPLQGTISMTEPTCFSYSDGTVTINLNGGTAPYSFLWNVPPPNNTQNLTNVTAGYYQVTVTDVNSCEITLGINIGQPNNIILQGQLAEEVCFGYPANLFVSEQNAVQPYNIIWTNPFDATQYLNNSNVVPPASGQYTATLTDANGCQQTFVKNITVNPLPDPNFTESDVTGCHPKCIDFDILNPQVNYTYSWSIGEPSLINQTSFTNCYDNEGVFTLKVIATSDKGCVDSLIKPNHIIINKTPIASFTTLGGDITDILNPTFDFYNLSQDGQSYIWVFGDGDSSQIENPSHTYLGTGNYCIKLETKAYYTTGIPTCVDSTENCVLIYPLSVLYVPNSFTPNGDTNNDFFAVASSRIDEFYMAIYNRWNEVLYKSFDIGMSWDGKYGGKDVPAGVYYYEIVYRDIKQQYHEQKGIVNVLR
jgi:gliding motility-associated-like protein